MKETNLIQGTPEWHAHRKNHRNASDTPAVMGLSPYKTRSDFLHQVATGIEPEIDFGAQRIFDDGHKFEALARPLMEELVGEDLFQVVGTDGIWSASFDGLNMMSNINVEHKTLNDTIRACNTIDDLPLCYKVQMAHQMMVSGAEKSLFIATKWKRDQDGPWYLDDKKYFWFMRDIAMEDKVRAAWDQFEIDVAAYVPPTSAAPAPVAEVVKDLPAVVVKVTGAVSIVDNFALFETELRDFVTNRLIRSPKSDQDFADLDNQIKALKKAEDALDAAEQQMIAQVSAVSDMKRTKDMLHALARDNRLIAEKLLAAEKIARKTELVTEARDELSEYLQEINSRVQATVNVVVDFASEIKGLRTIKSMQDAIGTAMANAKIEASEIAARIEVNRKVASDMSLVPDWLAVCKKAPDDFAALYETRLNARKQAEEQRLEAERLRIRAEEQQRANAEAAKRANDEAKAAEAARIAATPVPAPVPAKAPEPAIALAPAPNPVIAAASAPEPKQPEPASIIDCGKTIKLGEICARIGVTVNAEFLASLGFAATVEKGAKLYPESQFPTICRKLSDHILKAAFADHSKAA